MKTTGFLILLVLLSVVTAQAGVATIDGPTTVTVGANNVYTASMEVFPSGDEYYWSGGEIQISSASSATVKFYASGGLFYSLSTFDNYYSGYLEITIDVPTPTASGVGYTYNCGSTTVSRTTNPGSNFRWYWQTSSTGTSTALGYASSVAITSPGPLYLRARCIYDDYTWSSAQTIGGTVTIAGSVTSAGTIGGGSANVWSGTAPAQFTNSTLPGTTTGTDYTFQWQSMPSGGSWTNISGATSSSYQAGNLTLTTSFRRNVIANCDASVLSTSSSTVTVITLSVTCSSTPTVSIGSSVTLQSNPGSLASIQWIKDAMDITTTNGFPSNATSTTYAAVEPGLYQFRATYSGIGTSATSPSFRVYGLGENEDVTASSLGTIIIKKSGVTSSSGIYSLQSSEYAQSIQYVDGLGRGIQTIAIGQSPLMKDLIQPAAFDSVSSITYLPYAATSKNGWRRTTALDGGSGYSNSDQKNFYDGTTAVAVNSSPFSKALIESSALGRATEQGSFGTAWQPGGGHSVTAATRVNNSSFQVRKWTPDGPDGYYSANTLASTIVKDENGNKTIAYSNTLGQSILKRVQTSDMADSTTWLETYYVYDIRGNLRLQVPPSASAALNAGTSWDTTAFRDKWCFLYRYDSKNQLVMKKSPGAASTYYVYDRLGRLVLIQDGNLRTSHKWLFVKYDSKSRPVMTGFYTNTTDTLFSEIQANVVSPLYSDVNDPYYEERGTTLHGYTNQSFPTANEPGGSIEVISVNYYDHYDFDFNGSDDYSYTSQSLTGEGSQGNSFGFPTGSKRLIVGTTDWLYDYVFYDKMGRAIQTKSNNHVSATIDNLVTAVYSFDGKVIQKKTYHNAGGSNQTTVLNTYTYDHAGRVLTIKQKNNSDAEQIVAKYNYNELGQLVDKQLHNTGGSSYLQSVDFRYSIRGWLTSINNSQLSNDGTLNNDTDDYFGMELAYEGSAGMSNTAMYNGNISALKWKTFGEESGTAGQRSYKYSYDKSDRLLQATFQAYGTSAWDKQVNTLNEGMTYDHNGNILSLLRKQNEKGLSGTSVTHASQSLDDLTYTYASGNQLSKVDDAVLPSVGIGDFKDGASETTEYNYNSDGSLTADQNKGIDSIKYNDLGKVVRVKFTDGHFITYLYDASGTKLTVKNYNTSSTLVSTTDYVGTFVYQNGTLDFFSSPEGRVVKNASGLEYQYSIADHQGNTRVVFTSATPTAASLTATFEGDSGDDSDSFTGDFSISSFPSANHTPSGTNVVPMNQSTPVGPSKSMKVYPGDKIDLEVYSYFESSSGYGSSNVNASAMITAIAGAFGGVSAGGGESGLIYDGIDAALGAFGMGSNPGDSRPAAFLNYILMDKNYKVMDMGWSAVPATANFSKQKVSIPQFTVKEAGYLFAYLSYENPSNNYVYFDDFKITHTPTNIVQSNEYYPFGLQAARSWTRSNTSNNFLYNGGTESNPVSGLYDLTYRNYDPGLARMNQMDPMAHKYSSISSYNYSFNNPVLMNDPNGSDPYESVYSYIQAQWASNRNLLFMETLVADSGGGGGEGGDGPVVRVYSGVEAFAAAAAYVTKFNGWGAEGVAGSLDEAIAKYNAMNNSSVGGYGNLLFFSQLSHDGDGGLIGETVVFDLNDFIKQTQGNEPPSFGFSQGSDSWNTLSNYMTGIGMAVDGAAFSLGRALDKRLAYEFTKTGYQGFSVKTPSMNFRTPFGAVRASTGFVKGAANTLKVGGAVLGVIGVGMTGYEIYTGQKSLIGEGGLDLFMGGVAFYPVVGWGVSGAYFVGKWALEASGNDFWNKP
ncbi:MAG: hypothetical protein HOP08_16045 [Cyclobacteriaceae bacterium]|nr:hypothetical protein [Cyclobacteriaceae bacterium]